MHGVEYCVQLNDNVAGGLTNADLDRAKAAGARWFRFNCDMAFVWPTNTTFTNDTPDYAVGAASSQVTYAKSIGLKVLMMTGFTPSWLCYAGGGYPNCPPSDYATWATMCARAYRDLHTQVDAWEIWNEANQEGFWKEPTGGPNTYRTLLRQVVAAIRTEAVALGQSWGTPTIWSSGLASTGSGTIHWTDRWDRGYNPALAPASNMSIGTFLDQLFDNTVGIVPGTTSGTAYVDGYGVHTYTMNSGLDPLYTPFENPLLHCFQNTIPIGSSPYAFWDDIICAHESYSNPRIPPAGFKKLHATENGWAGSTGLYTAMGSETQVATAMDTAWTFWELNSYMGAGIMSHFQLRDDPATAGDAISKYGGLLHLDNSAKPIRATYRTHALNYGPPSTPSGVITLGDTTVTLGSTTVQLDGGIIGSGPPPPVPVGKIVTKIEFGVPPDGRNSPNSFVLNDTTRGKLNQSTYTLASDTAWIDITGDVQDIQTNRGRNRELDRTIAGTATITLRNDLLSKGTARRYDPNNWTSNLFPYIRPRSKKRITLDGLIQYTGLIETFDLHHENDGRTATVTFNCADSLVLLNEDVTITPLAAQTAHDRIRLILDIAGYKRTQFIVTGANMFQGAVVQTGTALDMVSDIAVGEQGMIWVNPLDWFVFVDRAYLAAVAPSFTITDQSSDALRYSGLVEQSGTELIYNQIEVSDIEQPNVGKFAAADLDSQGRYGKRTLPLTVPFENSFYCAFLAGSLLTAYHLPRARYRQVTIPLHKFAAVDRAKVLGLDLGSVITVKRTPIGGGTPATVTQDCIVIGIAHHGTPETMETVLTLNPRIT